ncbi:hypothetical protein K438DRAFT_1948155 [Mycena galopus ATCC 62051]|nr:hypothetical protein K438DRAFT_1948155 [Mycena galopus ATCC 62051]
MHLHKSRPSTSFSLNLQRAEYQVYGLLLLTSSVTPKKQSEFGPIHQNPERLRTIAVYTQFLRTFEELKRLPLRVHKSSVPGSLLKSIDSRPPLNNTRSSRQGKHMTFTLFGQTGNVVLSWLDSFGSSFTMSDSHLDWIWSQYTISPDPSSGMQSLYQTCSALIEHILQPSHIILRRGEFTLHLELADPLISVVPALDHLLSLAWKHNGLSVQPLCQKELQALTTTSGPSTQHRVAPLHGPSRPRFRSQAALKDACIVMALHPSLRAMIPTEFLRSYDIMVSPPAANTQRAASQQAAAHKHWEALHTPARCAQVPLDDIETGGLANSQISTTLGRRRHLQCAAAAPGIAARSRVSVSSVERQAADAPPSSQSIPAIVALSASCPSSRAVDLQYNLDTMAALVVDYTTDSDSSLHSRTRDVVKRKCLNEKNVVDRGINYSFGRFVLDASLLIAVDSVVKDMQSALTRASSLIRKTACFVVDPHQDLTGTLRGANTVCELHAGWTCLPDREDKYGPEAMHGVRASAAQSHSYEADITSVRVGKTMSANWGKARTCHASKTDLPQAPAKRSRAGSQEVETKSITSASIPSSMLVSSSILLLPYPVIESPSSDVKSRDGASTTGWTLPELENLVLASLFDIKTKVEVGGQVEQQCSKNLIALETYSVLRPSSATVPIVGINSVELGGRILEDSSSRKPTTLAYTSSATLCISPSAPPLAAASHGSAYTPATISEPVYKWSPASKLEAGGRSESQQEEATLAKRHAMTAAQAALHQNTKSSPKSPRAAKSEACSDIVRDVNNMDEFMKAGTDMQSDLRNSFNESALSTVKENQPSSRLKGGEPRTSNAIAHLRPADTTKHAPGAEASALASALTLALMRKVTVELGGRDEIAPHTDQPVKELLANALASKGAMRAMRAMHSSGIIPTSSAPVLSRIEHPSSARGASLQQYSIAVCTIGGRAWGLKYGLQSGVLRICPSSSASSAPALAFSESMVELGGPKGPLITTHEQQGDSEKEELRTLDISASGPGTALKPHPLCLALVACTTSSTSTASPFLPSALVCVANTGQMAWQAAKSRGTSAQAAVLVITILQTCRNSYLERFWVEDARPHLLRAREGIGTRIWNDFAGAGAHSPPIPWIRFQALQNSRYLAFTAASTSSSLDRALNNAVLSPSFGQQIHLVSTPCGHSDPSSDHFHPGRDMTHKHHGEDDAMGPNQIYFGDADTREPSTGAPSCSIAPARLSWERAQAFRPFRAKARRLNRDSVVHIVHARHPHGCYRHIQTPPHHARKKRLDCMLVCAALPFFGLVVLFILKQRIVLITVFSRRGSNGYQAPVIIDPHYRHHPLRAHRCASMARLRLTCDALPAPHGQELRQEVRYRQRGVSVVTADSVLCMPHGYDEDFASASATTAPPRCPLASSGYNCWCAEIGGFRSGPVTQFFSNFGRLVGRLRPLHAHSRLSRQHYQVRSLNGGYNPPAERPHQASRPTPSLVHLATHAWLDLAVTVPWRLDFMDPVHRIYKSRRNKILGDKAVRVHIPATLVPFIEHEASFHSGCPPPPGKPSRSDRLFSQTPANTTNTQSLSKVYIMSPRSIMGGCMIIGWVPKVPCLALPLQQPTFVGGRVGYPGYGMVWYDGERSDHRLVMVWYGYWE